MTVGRERGRERERVVRHLYRADKIVCSTDIYFFRLKMWHLISVQVRLHPRRRREVDWPRNWKRQQHRLLGMYIIYVVLIKEGISQCKLCLT